MMGNRIAIRGALALLLGVATVMPGFGAGLQPGWRFMPPPGITITQSKPRHALQLQANMAVNPVFLRQIVVYQTHERSGTLVIDTRAHFLYFVLGDGRALRYGIGVAKSGFEWRGTHQISR
ncbi:MAG: L,D-transpeptidase, partial [Alphaproteobacteria bacterium]|nr:L,D-transpeptidase [Alphaproteobacteria bacterium]